MRRIGKRDGSSQGTNTQGRQGAAREHHQGGRLFEPPGGYKAHGRHGGGI